MTNQEAIEQLKYDMAMILYNPDTGEVSTPEMIRLKNEDNYKTYIADQMAISALEKQEHEKWHSINPDAPESFPDDDRLVLVAFSNAAGIDIARWYTDDQGSGMFCPGDEDTPYTAHGIFVNAWKELPEKYEVSAD